MEKEKSTYEKLLSEHFDETVRKLDHAGYEPTLQNVKMAWSSVNSFCSALVYDKKHLKPTYFSRIRPVLKDIQTILYGNSKDPGVISKSLEYDAGLQSIKGTIGLKNGQNIIRELYTTLDIAKQVAYEEGLFFGQDVDHKEDAHGRITGT